METEYIFWYPSGLCFSHAQIRGSVPIFWEQPTVGLLPQQQRIQITRSPEATQSAFDKHFEALELKYGGIHVLNLLSATKIGESELSARYDTHIRDSSLNQRTWSAGHRSQHQLLQQSQYDFHAETREIGYEAARAVRYIIHDQAEAFAYFLEDEIHDTATRSDLRIVPILQQDGIFRTNCLDCLDRTNLIQTFISQMILEFFFAHRGEHASPDFWMRHSTLWADNGDALSKIYAGTGALKSSFTRHGKMSFAGVLADARKSATRLYINNFVDKRRQAVVDTLLGRLVDQVPVDIWDPINDFVSSELSRKIYEYSHKEEISIWAGSFNLNGRIDGLTADLSPWLRSGFQDQANMPSIVAIGLQEMVELSPQQIMRTDPTRRQQWEIAISRVLNEGERQRDSHNYVLLRSGQLVGAALIVFVKTKVLPSIRNVEGNVKQTGLHGMAGNVSFFSRLF